VIAANERGTRRSCATRPATRISHITRITAPIT